MSDFQANPPRPGGARRCWALPEACVRIRGRASLSHILPIEVFLLLLAICSCHPTSPDFHLSLFAHPCNKPNGQPDYEQGKESKTLKFFGTPNFRRVRAISLYLVVKVRMQLRLKKSRTLRNLPDYYKEALENVIENIAHGCGSPVPQMWKCESSVRAAARVTLQY